MDEESLRLMKAEIARHGVDVVVDYEHQTLDGVQAPAAGWVKELSIQDGHIVAKVEWTDRAAEYLKNREYRYLSPVITVRKLDGKATGLHSLASTNTPADRHHRTLSSIPVATMTKEDNTLWTRKNWQSSWDSPKTPPRSRSRRRWPPPWQS